MEKRVDTSLKLLVKTSFVVLIGVILSKILGYAYRIIIARYFGPEVYGLFTLSTTILSIFVFFFAMGLGDGISRFIPLYRGKKESAKIQHVFRITAIILAISGIFAACILFFSAEFISIRFLHNADLIVYLKIFSFLIPVFLFAHLFLNVLRSYEKISWFSFIFNVLQNATKVIFIPLFLIIGLGAKSVIFSHFLGISSMLIAGYLVCRYKIPKIFEKTALKSDAKKRITKDLIRYSLPFMPFSILSILLYWIDSFSIGYFRDVTSVGIYTTSVSIALLLNFVPELFMQLFFPMINKEYSRKNFDLINQLSRQVTKWIFVLNLPVFIVIILFPGVIINVLFGAEYLVGLNSLRLLAIGGFISSILIVSSNLLSMVGKSKLFFTNIVLAAALNLLLNYFLVPEYGIDGAAFATMLSYILLSILFFVEARHYASINPLKKIMIKIFFISLIPTIFLMIARKIIAINIFTLLLLGVIFVAIYLGLMVLTRCLDDKDLMILKAIKSKLYLYVGMAE